MTMAIFFSDCHDIPLPKLRWTKLTTVDILASFLILEEMISVFHHLEWFLWVCHIWLLLFWGRFPLCPLSRELFYHKWVLNFVKSFFCIYWDDHVVFILQFVNVVFHSDWFTCAEESLHPWDKPHLIMVYDALMHCCIWFVSTLLRIFESTFISDICL